MSRIAVVLAVTLWAAPGFGQAPAGDLGSESPIVVAVMTPLSGPWEHVGQRVARIARMASEEFDGVRLEIVDTGEDVDAAWQAVIASGAVAVVGPVGRDEVDAVVAMAREDDAAPPLFVLSSVDGIEDASAGVYRMRTSPSEQARALAAAAAGEGFALSFGVFGPDDEYGTEATRAFIDEIVARGGTVSHLASYQADPQEDLTQAAETLTGRRVLRLRVPTDPWRTPPSTRLTLATPDDAVPDAVFVPDYADRVADVLPFLQFHEWLTDAVATSTRLLGTSGWIGYELEPAGDLAAGAWVVRIYSPDDTRPGASAFADAFEVRFAEAVTEFDAQVYDAVGFVLSGVLWLDALGEAPSLLGPRLIEREAYPGVCGDTWLDEDGAVVRELGLWEVDARGLAYPVGVISPPGRE